jgi:hypothetical protein
MTILAGLIYEKVPGVAGLSAQEALGLSVERKHLILICYQDEPKCAMNRSWHDHEE